VDITVVDDLDWRFSTRCRTRTCRLRLGERDSVFRDGWVVAQSKDGVAEQLRGVGWNGHLSEIVGENRSLAADCTTAYIAVFDLGLVSLDRVS